MVRQVAGEGTRSLALLRWGLVPRGTGYPSAGSPIIHARSETAAEKPLFRDSMRVRRCLVPADGFFEWTSTPSGRQPYYFRRRDRGLFAFAALWNRRQGQADSVDSFAILTGKPNDLVARFHDRMPVILSSGAFDRWLDPGLQKLEAWEELFRPVPSDQLECHPVSMRVNSPLHDSPSCVEPIELPVQPELFG